MIRWILNSFCWCLSLYSSDFWHSLIWKMHPLTYPRLFPSSQAPRWSNRRRGSLHLAASYRHSLAYVLPSSPHTGSHCFVQNSSHDEFPRSSFRERKNYIIICIICILSLDRVSNTLWKYCDKWCDLELKYLLTYLLEHTLISAGSVMVEVKPIIHLMLLDEEETDVVVSDSVAAAHRYVAEALLGVWAVRECWKHPCVEITWAYLPMVLPKPLWEMLSKIANVTVTINDMTCA